MTQATRNELRAALVGKKHKPKSEVVSLFGTEVELRQPTLAAILRSREEDDERKRTTDVFLNYAYVPGTDELIFEEGDRDVILNWPFTEELFQVQMVIAKLTGVDISGAMEELKADPLPESS
jgi:hypothetical protein